MHKDYIINYLKFLFEALENKVDDSEIQRLIKNYVRRTATEKKVNQQDLLNSLSAASNALNRKFKINFVQVLNQLEEEQETVSGVNIPLDTASSYYRYNMAAIEKIYEEFAGRKISRQAINQHKRPDTTGHVKLPTIQFHGEYVSVVEPDLIDYFDREAGILLKPEDIRKYAYKKPIQYKEEGD